MLKGSKSFPVYYFLFYVYHKETRKKITFEEYKALSREQQQEYNVIPTYKYYSVFNLDQTNFSDVRPEEWEALREKFRGGQAEQPEIDAMLEAKSWFCPIREQQGDRAFYSPLADYIVVPLRSQFVDMQSFYETLLHEMGHSTGHPTRLNRDLAHPFGSEEYGKEELTAEFAAALAGMFFGIAEHIRTENAAYLKSWIYVGCSQNHPYCGEWLPNQVFRKRGLRPIRGKLKVRHRSQAGCWTNTIISTIPIRHEPQYWGRAAVRLHHYGERVNRARLVGAERNIHHLRQ